MTQRRPPIPPRSVRPAGRRPAARAKATSNGHAPELPVTLAIENSVLSTVIQAAGQGQGGTAEALVRAWLTGKGYPADVAVSIVLSGMVTVSEAAPQPVAQG